ncbi:MAG: hypothetical protein ABI596_01745 [Pyrinomonadaceae bacterium]
MPFHLHITTLLLLSGSFFMTAPKPPMPPAAPVLISPASGALMDNGCKPKRDGISWDFDWSDVPGATAYHIRVFRNPAIPLINNTSVVPSAYHYTSGPTDHIINSNLNLWKWMVRAKVHGTWGRWSAPRGFRVEKLNTDCP